MTTIMQPFQCDRQPQIQETNRTTHAGAATRCRTQRRNQNDRSRTRRAHTHKVPVIAGRSHFTRKNTRFRAPASSPKQSPCNIHAAITMRFAASHSKPASLYTHGNTRYQQSCSHYTAICLQKFSRLQPLYTENHEVLCSSFLPGTDPMQHSCSHYTAFRSITWLTRMYLRTWQHQMTTIMEPFQCDLQTHYFPSSPLLFVI